MRRRAMENFSITGQSLLKWPVCDVCLKICGPWPFPLFHARVVDITTVRALCWGNCSLTVIHHYRVLAVVNRESRIMSAGGYGVCRKICGPWWLPGRFPF